MQYEIKKFKDGQVTAKLLKNVNHLQVSIKGSSYEDLFKAASIKESWDAYMSQYNDRHSTLQILCLIGQRSDRRFNKRESFDLKVIARFINSMKFDSVAILHPHSSVSLALIDNSVEIDHYDFVKSAYQDCRADCIVSPDAGAYKSTFKISEKLGSQLVASNKFRDENGNPTINVSGNVRGKKCLIVDDLADGGRTFKCLAEELKTQGAEKVFLYVTHGQFNYGFDELRESLDHIYTTDSFRTIEDDFVTQYPAEASKSGYVSE